MSWFRSAGGEKVKYTTQYDKMTKQPVGSLVITLGIPTTISMLVTNIYNMVDTMFVGKLGTSASGAVGIVFGFMSILQAFGFLFGQGAGSIISRRLGNKDEWWHPQRFFHLCLWDFLLGFWELCLIPKWCICWEVRTQYFLMRKHTACLLWQQRHS